MCWGDNDDGESDVPADLGSVVGVAAGDQHTCAIEESGQLKCWGYNYRGQTNVPADLELW